MIYLFRLCRLILPCIGFWAFGVISPAQAQISSDGNLAIPTQVKSNDKLNFVITNGTQAGSNLFHSFQEFSIPTGGSALFDIPSSTTNIIGRVTGNQSSLIDGVLQTTGQANLFFLNPNGIFFGPNATLNLNGSFLATTAQAIRFANGQVFSSTPTPTDSLLTVSVPVGLQFGARANEIQVQNSSLSLQSAQTLGLVGGELSLTRANLFVQGGRIELGSVGPNSEVTIIPNILGYDLGYEQVKDFQDIFLTKGTAIDVTDLLSDGIEIGSGAVQVLGRNLTLTDGSIISSFTFGEKPGKQLSIITSESISLLGTGNSVGSEPTQIGSSGLATITVGNGNAGNINLTTQRLIIEEGGGISSSATSSLDSHSVGNSGNLTINASNSVSLAGSSPVVGVSSISVSTQTAGNAGNLTLNTGTLTLTDGGKISAETQNSGQGGNLKVTASKLINLTGQGTDIFIDPQGRQVFFTSPSTLTVTSEGSGEAGNLSLMTPQLTVTNNAEITASSFNIGNGGNLDLHAKQIELNNQGKLLASSEGKGQAGNLNIVSDQLTLNKGSQITVSSLGNGNAGNLTIKANNVLLNNQSQLIAETATGEGGNIAIELSEILTLRQNSLISTTAGSQGGGGNGGNIDINAKFVVSFPSENSDIIANAFVGQGGNIQINALGIFGIEPRANLTPLSDITASSTFGQFGVISINRVDVDPQSSLLTLPTEVIDPRNLIVQACGQGGEFSQGEFFVTGRGGLPINPQQHLETNTGLTDLGYPDTNIHSPKNSPKFTPNTPQSIKPQTQPILEAQGWFKNSHGKIVLTAQASSEKVNPGRVDSPNCHDLSKYFSILPAPVFSNQYSLAQ